MTSSYILPNGQPAERVCAWCRAGQHTTCQFSLDGFYDVGECCCDGQYDALAHGYATRADEMRLVMAVGGEEKPAKKKKAEAPAAGDGATVEATRLREAKGDSGYIHPDAWPSTRDIGTLVDPQSTGYKRMTEMYGPLLGKRCEWAGLLNAGSGPVRIIGCMGNEATEIHHGPDKNTLNNAKATLGVGEWEDNVWLICSFCHNAWHAANNPLYPPRFDPESPTDYPASYDRKRDQTHPWLPISGAWELHDPDTKAPPELLIEVQTKREEDLKRRGRDHGGRQRDRGTVDITRITDDGEYGDPGPEAGAGGSGSTGGADEGGDAAPDTD